MTICHIAAEILLNLLTTQNHISHRACLPRLSCAGFYSPFIHLSRHRSKRQPSGDHILYDRVYLTGEGIRRRHVRPCSLPAIQAWIAELHAPELGLRHCCLCPLRDHDPFVFGHGGKDMNREPGRLWHIDGQKLNPAFHEIRDEGNRPGEPVELSDQEGCLLPAAEIKRPSELGTISPPAALDFGKLAREFAADPREVLGNCLALRVQSKTGAALPIRGNTVIGNEKRGLVRLHGGNVKRQRSL